MAETEDYSAQDYSVEVIEDYTPSYYEPPPLFSRVGPFVGNLVTRKVDTNEATTTSSTHQSSILAFVSGNRQEQMEYLNALLGIGIFMLCILIVWVTILLGLKCMGRGRVGCAAGYPFRSSNSDDAKGDNPEEEEAAAAANPKDEQGDNNEDERGKTMKETSSNSDDAKGDNPKEEEAAAAAAADRKDEQGDNNENERGKTTKETSTKANNPNEDWIEIGGKDKESNPEEDNNNCQAKAQHWMQAVKTWMFSDEPKHVERRKFQSRCTYAVFSLVSIISSGLLIAYIYRPLQSAIETSGSIVSDVTDIVEDVAGVIESLDIATNETGAFLELFPQDFQLLCPTVGVENFETKFGFNPIDIVKIVSNEYKTYVPEIQTKLRAVADTGDSVADILMDVNSAISSTDDYTWILVLVICLTILIILSQLVLMLVVMYRERNVVPNDDGTNNTRLTKFENCFGWTILPLHVFVVLISYILVIVFCFTTFLSAETCMPQFNNPNLGVGVGVTEQGRGTPDDVVIAVLGSYVNGESFQFDGLRGEAKKSAIEAAKNRLKGFIVGCDGSLAQRGEDEENDVENIDRRFLQLLENNNATLDGPLDGIKESMNETLGDLKEKEPLNNMKEGLNETVDNLKEGANETLSNLKEKEPLNTVKDKANETWTNVKDSDQLERLEENLKEQIEKLLLLLEKAHKKLNEKLAPIREKMNDIDGECGSSSLLSLLLRDVLVLNGVYGDLIIATRRGVVAVSCPSLNGLYVQAMYDLFCTDFATISANGFVLFFIISFSGFVLISLRASWRTAE